MAAEPLQIFDPHRNMHILGFSGRAATTTLHDATATGVSISGIFQAAEDFAVLCIYNAFDYFNHLRLKPLPRTDLSGLKLEFDIEYLKQMYKECADEIAATGLPVVLQLGETQWWYFPNASGMPYYDDETKAALEAIHGRPMHRFLASTDDPNDDIATADFLRDRIWAYCQDVITCVRQFHPTAVFECLWPLDANQGKPAPDPAFRALNFHVNLPNEWKTSSYGVKYFRAEGFDFDVWQKNALRMRQTMEFPLTLGRPPEECMYLAGIYGPPDPPMAQAYGMWRTKELYSFCFWAFDQFCLHSRPVPLEVASQARATAVTYHKPRAGRALEAVVAVPVAAADGGALNRFEANDRRLNG